MAWSADPPPHLDKLSSVDDYVPCSHPSMKAPPEAYDRMMTILVEEGGRKKKFQMHRGVLCFHSEYFKAMLDGGFSESGRNFLKLTNVDIDTFQRFYDWMNTGTVVVDFDDQYRIFLEIVKIFVFADYHQVQAMKNRALELLFLTLEKIWIMPSSASEMIYHDTPAGSPLRKFLVDIHVEAYGFENWRAWADQQPKDFLADIIDACKDAEIAPGGKDIPLRRLGRHGWIQEKKKHFCERYHEHQGASTQGIATIV